MSDERLRALKRRFQETQSLEDAVVSLREQIRCGEVTREGALLAASWGDPSASSLFEVGEVPLPEFGPEDLGRFPQSRFQGTMGRGHPWARLVFGLGRDTLLRILLAVGRLSLPEWREPEAEWGARVFRASELFVRESTPERFLELRAFDRTSPAREELCTPRHSALGSDFPVENLADRVAWSYKGVIRDRGFGAYFAVSAVQRWSSMLVAETEPEVSADMDRYLAIAHGLVLCEALNGAMFATSKARVLEALRDEVTPWLLGRDDSVSRAPLGGGLGG